MKIKIKHTTEIEQDVPLPYYGFDKLYDAYLMVTENVFIQVSSQIIHFKEYSTENDYQTKHIAEYIERSTQCTEEEFNQQMNISQQKLVSLLSNN